MSEREEERERVKLEVYERVRGRNESSFIVYG